MTISPLAAYVIAVLLLYLWIVGGLGWKGVYERDMERTFTMGGTIILILIWVPITFWSGLVSSIEALRAKGEE